MLQAHFQVVQWYFCADVQFVTKSKALLKTLSVVKAVSLYLSCLLEFSFRPLVNGCEQLQQQLVELLGDRGVHGYDPKLSH